jgi:riboflavin synthase
MGGHLVQGHVDGVGRVISIARLDSSWLVEIGIPEHLTRYVIPVGSIAVDGVSLTVARLSGSRLTIAVIPHTLEQTTLGTLAPGRKVNIECDLVGKYVERLVRAYAPPGSGELSEDLLRRWGYGSGTA